MEDKELIEHSHLMFHEKKKTWAYQWMSIGLISKNKNDGKFKGYASTVENMATSQKIVDYQGRNPRNLYKTSNHENKRLYKEVKSKGNNHRRRKWEHHNSTNIFDLLLQRTSKEIPQKKKL